jgi:hypothetical protein
MDGQGKWKSEDAASLTPSTHSGDFLISSWLAQAQERHEVPILHLESAIDSFLL